MFGDSIAQTTEPGVVAAFSAAGVTVVEAAFPGVGLVNIPGMGEFAHIITTIADAHPQLVLLQLSPWDAQFGEDHQFQALTTLHQVVVDAHAQLAIMPMPPLRSDQVVAGIDGLVAAARRAALTWPADVVYLDTNVLWGDHFQADINGDHVPERMYDGVHLCASGSALVGAWLVNAVAGLFDGITPAPVAEWANGDWVNRPMYNNPPGACAAV